MSEKRKRVRSGEEKSLDRIAGFPAVSAVFARGAARVERLFFNERNKPRVSAFCADLARARRPYRLVPAAELDRIAGTAMHGGIVALVRPQPLLRFNAQEAERWSEDGRLLLVLDGIANPHNLGAIVRTAAFFGITRIVLSDHPAQALPSDASHRVAEGGSEYVQLYRAERLPVALKQLRKAYRVVGTAPGAKIALTSLKRGDKAFALVLGNEEEGLARPTLSACDDIIAIAGSGAVQSLNVAASAAILLFALSQ